MNNSKRNYQVGVSEIKIKMMPDDPHAPYISEMGHQLRTRAYISGLFFLPIYIEQWRAATDELQRVHILSPNNTYKTRCGTLGRRELLRYPDEYIRTEIQTALKEAFVAHLDALNNRAPKPEVAPERVTTLEEIYEYEMRVLEDIEMKEVSSQSSLIQPAPDQTSEPQEEGKPKRRTFTLPPALVKRAIKEMTEKKMEMTSRAINKYIGENYFKYSE